MSSMSRGVWPIGTLPCWSHSWKTSGCCAMESQDSTAQPDPWIVVPAASNWPLNPSKEPKCWSIIEATSPSGRSPPSGDMFCQKTEWLVCPPRLNARFFSSIGTVPKSPESRAAASFSSAVLAPST